MLFQMKISFSFVGHDPKKFIVQTFLDKLVHLNYGKIKLLKIKLLSQICFREICSIYFQAKIFFEKKILSFRIDQICLFENRPKKALKKNSLGQKI
jgi:hypothetical protein